MHSLKRRAWARWQAAAGPWQGWSVCPLLCAPEADEVTPRDALRPTAQELANKLAASLLCRAGTLVLLDLDPIVGVEVAADLNRWQLANVVLLLPRWPYAQAVLPVDALLHVLLRRAWRLTSEPLQNVVFVLDAERNKSMPRRSASDPRADNRYTLSAEDLPNLAALRSRRIERVLKLCSA